jgi:hypothetical protein
MALLLESYTVKQQHGPEERDRSVESHATMQGKAEVSEAERLRSLAGPAARHVMPRTILMPARSSATPLFGGDSVLETQPPKLLRRYATNGSTISEENPKQVAVGARIGPRLRAVSMPFRFVRVTELRKHFFAGFSLDPVEELKNSGLHFNTASSQLRVGHTSRLQNRFSPRANLGVVTRRRSISQRRQRRFPQHFQRRAGGFSKSEFLIPQLLDKSRDPALIDVLLRLTPK